MPFEIFDRPAPPEPKQLRLEPITPARERLDMLAFEDYRRVKNLIRGFWVRHRGAASLAERRRVKMLLQTSVRVVATLSEKYVYFGYYPWVKHA